jgi:biotin transport system substrate-specific component
MRENIMHFIDVNELARLIRIAIYGCLWITIGSLLRIPCYPVPFTCQTLAIFILALTYSPKEVLAMTFCYLVCATVGLPVLDGRVNSFWMLGKSGGYLFSFPLAAYLIARLRQKISVFIALCCGNALILFCGWLWLIPFLGPKIAFMKGVLIFLPAGMFKAALAIFFVKRRAA